MQKRISFALITVIAGIFLLYSCSYDTLVPEKINPNKTVSFASDIQPIFTANCLGCHGGTTTPDLRAGNSYSSLISGNFINKSAPAQSVIYLQMAPNGGMSSYTNSSQASLVLLWIQQGANDN